MKRKPVIPDLSPTNSKRLLAALLSLRAECAKYEDDPDLDKAKARADRIISRVFR